jgi:hypothetical protein
MTTLALREWEHTDTRVLAALRCVDASTGLPIEAGVSVSAPGARWLRKPGGLFVLMHLPALQAHTEAFAQPPALPAVGSLPLEVTVQVASGQWLPRTVTLNLPRNPNPAQPLAADSLFHPVPVLLYPSPAAPVGANWAVLRVTLVDAANGDALGGALLRVQDQGQVLARGMTDERGQALLAVPGVPRSTWGEDVVLAQELQATVQAVFDPAQGTRRSATEVAARTAPAQPPLPNPDALERDRARLPNTVIPVALMAGREQRLPLSLAFP